jgi:hypothetical protein
MYWIFLKIANQIVQTDPNLLDPDSEDPPDLLLGPVTDIKGTLGGGSEFVDLGDDGFIGDIGDILYILYVIGTIICVIIIILAGYQYFFSRGEQGKADSAKKAIINAAIGLGVIILAFVIQNTVVFVLDSIEV